MKTKNELQELEDLQEKINEIRKETISFREIKTPFGHKLEVGKWYKYGDWLVYITKINVGKFYYYGFNGAYGVWVDNDYISCYLNRFKLATDKEVEDALIAEAIKRGFKNGVRFKSTLGDYARSQKRPSVFRWYKYPSFNVTGVTLDCGSGTGLIYNNGKWAEIIEDIKPKIK